MSYEVTGSGEWYFPQKSWKENVKSLWDSIQDGKDVDYDILESLYQISQLLSREDFMMYLTGKHSSSMLPIIKSGKVKLGNKEESYEKGRYFYVPKDQNILWIVEEKTFGSTLRGGSFGGGRYSVVNYPKGYNAEELEGKIRFFFTPKDKPKLSKSDPQKLSKVDHIVIDALQSRMSSLSVVRDSDGGYFDAKNLLASRLDSIGNITQESGLSGSIEWDKKLKISSEKNLYFTAKMLGTWKKSPDYAIGGINDKIEPYQKYFEDKDWPIVKTAIRSKLEPSNLPRFVITQLSYNVKDIGLRDLPSYSKGKTYRAVVMEFEIIIQCNFPKYAAVGDITEQYEGNDTSLWMWNKMLKDNVFGTLVPSMQKPVKSKKEKMPSEKWSYGAVTGDGRSEVTMDVDIEKRRVKISFQGNSSDNYAFSSPATSKLSEILNNTKWTKDTGGLAYATGEDGQYWEFAKFGVYSNK